MMRKYTIILVILMLGCVAGVVEAKDYLSGEICSNDDVLYGKFEVHMKPAKGSGLISSFFLYKTDSHKVDVPWNEIDIEILGKDTTKVQTNILSGPEYRISYVKLHDMESDVADNFHTYTLEWTPKHISFAIDGKQIRYEDKRQVDHFWNQPMTYRFNLWPTHHSGWAGAFDDSVLPAYHTIDWIRYYEYTPGAGPDGSDFTFAWADNFDTFDEKRWNKAFWTFPENLSKFSDRHVVVEDGLLYLILEKR
ncbi:MAG: family 16 glycosylhydrolase [Candidatus Omnitrophica bacterium]|nr:family 16 glycosylhydrolase [Candidatus Omnitrophota bacterium]